MTLTGRCRSRALPSIGRAPVGTGDRSRSVAAVQGELLARQVSQEPASRELCHLLQRAGLLEEVRGPRHDLQPLLAAELSQRLLVHFDDRIVPAADDEQGGGPDLWQDVTGQVRPAPA